MENEKREIVMTADGSSSVSIPALGIGYHSHHGAIQESRYIFIEAGLSYVLQQNKADGISIFEMGFGTGLNALLTAIEAEKKGIAITYHTIDEYPLTLSEALSLNYPTFLNNDGIFKKIHVVEWHNLQLITPLFHIKKEQVSLQSYQTRQQFHLIYFDAFGPDDQPELWTEEVFKKMFSLLVPGGILVTYCSKSSVRKAMAAAGYTVTKLPGPKGKREIVRAARPPVPRWGTQVE